MKNFLSIFKHMNVLDWVLAIAFIALASYAVFLVFPPNGWIFGFLAGLLLLYLAKKRRDRLAEHNHQNSNQNN